MLIESGGAIGFVLSRSGHAWRAAAFIWKQGNFLRQVFCSHLLRAPFGVPFFFSALVALFLSGQAVAEEATPPDIEIRQVIGSDFRATHDALVEAIEGEGLVVGAVIPFKQMLVRTEASRADVDMPYGEAEIIQFCSSGLAWQMIGEQASQLALCPLSIAIYSDIGKAEHITISWRSPGRSTPGRSKADDLLRRLVERTVRLARLRW